MVGNQSIASLRFSPTLPPNLSAFSIIDQIFEFLDKDDQLKKDLETYDTMYSNRELAKNKIELKTWK